MDSTGNGCVQRRDRYIYFPERCINRDCIYCTPRIVELYNIYQSRPVQAVDRLHLWTTVAELREVTDCQVISKSVAAVVVQMSEKREPDDHIPISRLKVAIADTSGSINLFICRQREVLFSVGQSVILSHFVIRLGAIHITDHSFITRRNALVVPDDVKADARLGFFVSFSPVIGVRDIVQSREDYRTSVEGTVTDAGFLTLYTDRRGFIRYKRFIRLHQAERSVFLMLHSSAAAHCQCALGDSVLALDVLVTTTPTVGGVMVVVIYEDQLKVSSQNQVDGELVILLIQVTDTPDVLWTTVQFNNGVRQLYLERETIMRALNVQRATTRALQQYLPITATGTVQGNYVLVVDVVQHRQNRSSEVTIAMSRPEGSVFPVTVAEPIEYRFTVEAAISAEEGYRCGVSVAQLQYARTKAQALYCEVQKRKRKLMDDIQRRINWKCKTPSSTRLLHNYKLVQYKRSQDWKFMHKHSQLFSDISCLLYRYADIPVIEH